MNSLLIYNDMAILVLRLALGVIFLAHGWDKLSDLKDKFAYFQKNGFRPGWFWGSIATFIQFGGGLLLLVGLFTQITAIIVAVMMVVILGYHTRRKTPFGKGVDFSLILLASLLLLATLGDGAYALNNLLF